MTPEQMNEMLNSVKKELIKADDLSPVLDANGDENEWMESIGSIIVAVNHLREVVQALIEKG